MSDYYGGVKPDISNVLRVSATWSLTLLRMSVLMSLSSPPLGSYGCPSISLLSSCGHWDSEREQQCEI